ncbi:MAG: PAN domain-containing protein, partial [Methanotrichaceae archaeon]|nr:PAN domain-containing protein [Methanotrichaceae archaeon]
DNNTDLPGSDYKNLELSTANPNLCALECSVDSACRAFTYVKPGYQGPNAQCWLKNAVPDQVQAECCVSGVKRETNALTSAELPETFQQLVPSPPGVAAPEDANVWTSAEIPETVQQPELTAPPQAPTQVSIMDNTDLPGADYKSFDLKEADPNLCARACIDDPQCRAFVYGKPGYQGPIARCWLKNGLPSQIQSECCMSGVKGLE